MDQLTQMLRDLAAALIVLTLTYIIHELIARENPARASGVDKTWKPVILRKPNPSPTEAG